MQTLDVHGLKVQIDEDSDTVKYGVEYLKKLSGDEAKVFFDAAKRDLVNGVSHLETPHDGQHNDIGHHLTIIHNSDGSYLLRRRTGY